MHLYLLCGEEVKNHACVPKSKHENINLLSNDQQQHSFQIVLQPGAAGPRGKLRPSTMHIK